MVRARGVLRWVLAFLTERQAAERLCTAAIERDSQNVKALYRRALANISLHEYGAAKVDLLSAVKLDPANKAVRTKLLECGEAASREKVNERRLYAAMFGATSQSKADDVDSPKTDGADSSRAGNGEFSQTRGDVSSQVAGVYLPQRSGADSPTAD